MSEDIEWIDKQYQLDDGTFGGFDVITVSHKFLGQLLRSLKVKPFLTRSTQVEYDRTNDVLVEHLLEFEDPHGLVDRLEVREPQQLLHYLREIALQRSGNVSWIDNFRSSDIRKLLIDRAQLELDGVVQFKPGSGNGKGEGEDKLYFLPSSTLTAVDQVISDDYMAKYEETAAQREAIAFFGIDDKGMKIQEFEVVLPKTFSNYLVKGTGDVEERKKALDSIPLNVLRYMSQFLGFDGGSYSKNKPIAEMSRGEVYVYLDRILKNTP